MSEEFSLSRCSDFEIDCLRVEKIFDACSTRVCETFDFNPAHADHCIGESGTVEFANISSIISCVGLDGATVEGTITSRPGTPIADVRATITGFVLITVRTRSGSVVELVRQVTFESRVLLFAPRPLSMSVCGEALIKCLGCVLVPAVSRIRCSVGAFIIIKTCGLVEVRIPVFGLCPVPPECVVLSEANACEVFLNPDITDFPTAQDFFPPQQNTSPIHKHVRTTTTDEIE